ncbi:hypothetical protein BKA66DRAFT_55613 [Pyrenochaeta sp. MPI-SDFR-AT-0127]|nr:hypothetical protein BKA66DRAFT_55613 [Pyrenochaeta sp. MPI-SDFR-AT-0127]
MSVAEVGDASLDLGSNIITCVAEPIGQERSLFGTGLGADIIRTFAREGLLIGTTSCQVLLVTRPSVRFSLATCLEACCGADQTAVEPPSGPCMRREWKFARHQTVWSEGASAQHLHPKTASSNYMAWSQLSRPRLRSAPQTVAASVSATALATPPHAHRQVILACNAKTVGCQCSVAPPQVTEKVPRQLPRCISDTSRAP